MSNSSARGFVAVQAVQLCWFVGLMAGSVEENLPCKAASKIRFCTRNMGVGINLQASSIFNRFLMVWLAIVEGLGCWGGTGSLPLL